jgi:hypothetical protein
LSNDPIRESLDQKLRDFCTCTAPETRCCACTEDCYAVKEYDTTLRAVLDMCDEDDGACFALESKIRRVIAESLGVPVE